MLDEEEQDQDQDQDSPIWLILLLRLLLLLPATSGHSAVLDYGLDLAAPELSPSDAEAQFPAASSRASDRGCPKVEIPH